MKILFIGNFDVPYTTENHHKRTYEKLGHEVTTLREGKTNGDIIINELRGKDLLVFTHTHGWHTEGIRYVLKEKGLRSAIKALQGINLVYKVEGKNEKDKKKVH